MAVNLKSAEYIAKYVEQTVSKDTKLFGGGKSILHTSPVHLDCADFKNLKPLEKDVYNEHKYIIGNANNKSEIKAYHNLMINEFINQEFKDIENQNNPIIKVSKNLTKGMLKIGTHLVSPTIEIVKNQKGEIIGGFGYKLSKSVLDIQELVISNELQKTKEGIKILKGIAQRIKKIAQNNNSEKIICESVASQKHLSKLYTKMGFKIEKTFGFGQKIKYSTSMENFGKNYL